MSTDDLANDEHVRGRGMYVELDHPEAASGQRRHADQAFPRHAEIQRSRCSAEHTPKF